MKGKILKSYVLLVLFIFPWFFLPLVNDSIGWGKNWFLMISALVGLVFWVVEWLLASKKEIKGGVVLGWMALALVVVLISLFSSPKVEWVKMWLRPMGGGSWLALLVWSFLLTQVSSVVERKKWMKALSFGTMILGLTSLVLFLKPEASFPIILPSTENPLFAIGGYVWSSFGSLFLVIALFLILGVYWFFEFRRKMRKGEAYVTEAVVFGVSFLMFLLSSYLVFKYKPARMDLATAWVITVEAFKVRPFTGVGPGNFLTAFLQFRPNFYNLTDNWNRMFAGSRTGFFNLWTELGLLGVGWFLALVWRVFKDKKRSVFWWTSMIGLGAMFLIPMSTSWMFLLVILLSALYQDKMKEMKGMKLVLGEEGKDIAPFITAGLCGVGILAGGYFVGRFLYADILFQRSIIEISTGKGVEAYSTQVRAVGMNPDMSDYRVNYSQTNLGLVKGILAAEEELSEEDKQQASVLLQQSIREAKAAVSLEPSSSLNWSNLASIYRDVIGIVEGADQWAVTAYQQAVALDPANPILRIDLGGLFYGANQFDEAERFFEAAVMVKENHPNAWYNWAYNAKQRKDLGAAVGRLQQALALVPADSADYEKVFAELTEWKAELEKLTGEQQEAQESQVPQEEALIPPQVLPTPAEEAIEIPVEDAAPPEPEVQVNEEQPVGEEEQPVEERVENIEP
jgi:Tfp pilus assembly protein PilF